MSEFKGFPARPAFTSVPNAFFSSLLPEIDDLAELRTILHVIAALYRKKGYPQFVSFNELLGDAALVSGLKKACDNPEETLRRALKMAVEHGALLGLLVDGNGKPDEVYLLNDEPGRQALSRIASGELDSSGLKAGKKPEAPAEEIPDIFTLYEQNIGLLTPMIADELKEAEKLYPPEWLRDAVREAALHNKRNIRYISKILENWSEKGRGDGTYQRDSQKTGPDRYFKGKYGHMVRR